MQRSASALPRDLRSRCGLQRRNHPGRSRQGTFRSRSDERCGRETKVDARFNRRTVSAASLETRSNFIIEFPGLAVTSTLSTILHSAADHIISMKPSWILVPPIWPGFEGMKLRRILGERPEANVESTWTPIRDWIQIQLARECYVRRIFALRTVRALPKILLPSTEFGRSRLGRFALASSG